MKLIIRLILGSFMLHFIVSCNAPNNKSDGKSLIDKNDGIMEMIEYVTSRNDTIMIPRNVADYNRFLADSVSIYNCDRYLFAMLESKPKESFEYAFDNRFDDDLYSTIYLDTNMSSDSLVRIYSLNISRWGHHIFIQYKNKNNIHMDYLDAWLDEKELLRSLIDMTHLSEEERYAVDGYNGGIRYLYTIVDNQGQSLYLANVYQSAMPRESAEEIIAFRIKDGRPQKVPLFNTGKKRVCDIDAYLEFYHSDEWHNADSIFVYNDKTRDLYIPLIEEYEFQDKYLIYHFDGTEFKYSGIR